MSKTFGTYEEYLSARIKQLNDLTVLGLPMDDLEGLDDPLAYFDYHPPKPRTDPRFSDTALITRFINDWTMFPVGANELYEAFRSTLAQGHQQRITGTKFGRVAASLLTRQHTRTMNMYLDKKEAR